MDSIFSFTFTGIFNGTKGTVVGFGYRGKAPDITLPPVNTFHTMPTREIPIVFVKMDVDIGYTVDVQPNVLPFTAIQDDTKAMKLYHRMYMPLLAAQATTTHKAQGTTAHNGVVAFPSAGTPWARALEYVMCTRQTMLEKLILITPLRKDHFQSQEIEKHQIDIEYNRLRTLFLL
jgi:hypothetical protein